jgi:hypothetical protein
VNGMERRDRISLYVLAHGSYCREFGNFWWSLTNDSILTGTCPSLNSTTKCFINVSAHPSYQIHWRHMRTRVTYSPVSWTNHRPSSRNRTSPQTEMQWTWTEPKSGFIGESPINVSLSG